MSNANRGNRAWYLEERASRDAQHSAIAANGEPPDMSAMNERLAKLEGAFDGFKTVLTIFGGVVALSITITIAGIVFVSGRLDRVEAGVSALPDKISGNLRDLTGTLSQAITAAKQTPPQVILMGPPSQPASSPPKPD